MAAFAPLHSAEYLNFTAVPVVHVPSADWNGKLRSAQGTLTFTAAGTGTAKMIVLPAGRKIIYPDLCRIVCPVGTATADLHIGHSAYTKPDGTTVAADDNAFADNVDVGGGAIDAAWTLPAVGYYVIDSKEPVTLEVMIDTANSPAAGEMLLSVVYAAGN